MAFPQRDGLDRAAIGDILETVGLPAPLRSSFRWSSMNGYGLGDYTHVRSTKIPNFSKARFRAPEKRQACSIKGSCLDKINKLSAVDVFNFFAFVEPSCGDCGETAGLQLLVGSMLIFQLATTAAIFELINKSGVRGLSSFLPPPSVPMPGSKHRNRAEGVPHLPLTSTWTEADFSLGGVASGSQWRGRDRRSFSLRLLQRYQYTLGASKRFTLKELC